MSNLVIVESPTKANTIKSYLGSGYKVVASLGHVRDLPKSKLGIDIENNFEPHYINIRGKGPLIKDLLKETKNAKNVYFATDSDREGEAISWHLATALGIPADKSKRVIFNEITKNAVKSAIKNPRSIDMDLVDSQQARRLLDRIVGYKLSPYLWKTVRSGLSAGRVQSVATRIIVEREEEIRAFVPKEFWRILAHLETDDGKLLKARFHGDSKKIDVTTKEQADSIVAAVKAGPFIVSGVKKSQKQRNPSPPFTTSTLQQDSHRKLGYSASRTMQIAQELYEGINLGTANGGTQGLITYMRTDSLRVSSEAVDTARDYITSTYGADYYPKSPRVYKSRNSAQDAHEAIRPVDITLTPDKIKGSLSSMQYKLYKLIWSRFAASQMTSAIFDTVNADIMSGGYVFKASGSTLKFPGFLSVYESAQTDAEENEGEGTTTLPELVQNQKLKCNKIDPEQHFTEPPPRFNDASLIKLLEERGIGRPSTFASIVTTITSRGYVGREGKSLVPTPLGEITNKLMVEKFSDVVDYTFTATMEEKLDDIGQGSANLKQVLADFYGGFEASLNRAIEEVGDLKIDVPDDELDVNCENCGEVMIVKSGRFGKFAACKGYPECKTTKPLDRDGRTIIEKAPPVPVPGMECEQCGAGMVLRSGRYGNFHACEKYPTCKFIKQIKVETGASCPECTAPVLLRRSKSRKIFYSCDRYPECSFSSFDLPSAERCPDCNDVLYHKNTKANPHKLACKVKGCGFKKDDLVAMARAAAEETSE